MTLQCRPLADIVPHCFTTTSLTLEGIGGEGAQGWVDLARFLGVELDALVRVRQVHGTSVALGRPCAASDQWAEADIVISDDPAVALSVRTADCVPTLLADESGRAVAAVHAGWKGTAEGAVVTAVRALEERFGAPPASLVAAVGPSIGPCCYEVGPELVEKYAVHREAPSWFSQDLRPHLDLWRATGDQLRRAGVPEAHIHIARLCTFDQPALFHSYRRQGRRAGRLAAAIRSAPGKTL